MHQTTSFFHALLPLTTRFYVVFLHILTCSLTLTRDRGIFVIATTHKTAQTQYRIELTKKFSHQDLLKFSFLIHRTSLFIVTSLVYALLLIVICISYVVSDVTTHKLPVMYYEGFFTYLYGASILFLLYVFCFLLQGN